MTITAITKYRAEDGTEFTSQEKALAYAEQAERILRLMSRLAPRPEPFPSNGYLQHDGVTAKEVWNSLLDIAAEISGPHHFYDQSRDMVADSSWAGRILGEFDHKVLWSKGWFRMQCIDRKTFREYQQPYFATHPEEGGTICLNPGHE